MTRTAEIADRLHRLAKRREDEGIYTDAALCAEASQLLSTPANPSHGVSERHPLEVYADSYAEMARMGDGKVDCRSVEVDIRQNMIPVTAAIGAGGQAVAAHPDDLAVDRFASVMKAKLAKKRADGYSGWNDIVELRDRLSRMLRNHVEKGDPVDVANLAMMLHQRGETIAPALSNPPAQPGWRMVPEEPTAEMLKAAGECFSRMRDVHGGATGADYYRAMLSASPLPEGA